MLDTNFMNLGQIAHQLLSLFYPIYHFWGLKGGGKLLQIILAAKTYV